MKIASIETVRIEEHPNLLWVMVRTDEGVVPENSILGINTNKYTAYGYAQQRL